MTGLDRAAAMTERELQKAVIDAATAFGWLIHHDRPARMKDGSWRTPIQGNRGFPDLVLAHPVTESVLFVELKREKGKPSEKQQRWLDALGGEVWRPSNWLSGAIEDILRAGSKHRVRHGDIIIRFEDSRQPASNDE